MNGIRKPSIERTWAHCPSCGAKTVILDDNAHCSGVHIKCTRGCKCVFELVVRDGVQQMKKTK